MKKLLLSLCLLFLLSQTALCANQDMRGVWVSSVYNLDFPSAPGLSAEEITSQADLIISKANACGLTDIFLQVRPSSDALYKSEIFPSSAYVCNTQGDAFPDDIDILEYFINKSAEYGIKVHAWINPYRITRGSFTTKEEALASLSPANPAHKLTQYVVFNSDGNLYFDPSSAEVRALICNGIREIASNYNVAGIHFDDYFYPSADFDDTESYNANKLDGEDIHSFRVRQVDSLIYEAYECVKSIREDCLFGVSPFGVWANKSNNEDGSETNSSQSYYDHYADTLKWVKDEKLDYIMPQLYWNIGNAEADYKVLLDWWNDAVSDTDVKLYTGLAAYRITENQLGYTADEISSQISLNTSADNCSGFCIFRFGSINESLIPVLSAFAGSNEIYIAVEADNFQTELPRFHFYGQAHGALLLNNHPVETSESGYFSISKPLVYGNNSFTFSYGNSARQINIYRNYTPHQSPAKYDIVKYYDGETITASFSAYKTNVSFYGYFSPADIMHEYFGDKTYFVEILKNDANVYRNPTTDEGSVVCLQAGSLWKASAEKGEFIYLEDLGWTKWDNCKIMDNSLKLNGRIRSVYAADDSTVRFEYSGKVFPAITESENGYSLHFSGCTELPELPDMIKNGSLTINSSGMVYTFTPIINTDISGYYIDIGNGYSDIVFVPKKISDDMDTPLSGFSFLLDAGHGGSDCGALSCSPEIAEKDVNLDYALLLGEKLSSLGADVEYTRMNDDSVSLDKRYEMAVSSGRIFISLHCDSLPHSSTVDNPIGISLHANSRHSADLASFIGPYFESNNITVNYVDDKSNLYMTKSRNTYSLLIENQFVSSPDSFELLTNDEYMNNFTDLLCTALCNFFAG